MSVFPNYFVKTIRKSTIAFRLLFYIMLVSFLFTVVGTLLQLYFDYQTDIEMIDEQMFQIEKSYLKSLAKNSWDLDINGIELILEGALQLRDIRYLEVKSEIGHTLAIKGSMPDEVIKHITLDLVYKRQDKDHFVGSLYIAATLEGVYQRLLNKLIVILSTEAIKIFCLSAFILIIFRQLVTLHLKTMSNYARKRDINQLNEPLVLKRKTKNIDYPDELDQVVNALNDMRRNLLQDIEERKKIEKELKNIRNYLDNIVNSMPSILIGVNSDGKVMQWNQEAEKKTGISSMEAEGKTLDALLPMFSEQIEKIQETIRQKQAHKAEKVAWKEKGKTYYSDILVYPLASNDNEGAVIRVDDVSHKVRMEEMMVQTEKMISIGGLTAGMAHELNNPLGAILNGAQNLSRRFLPDLKRNQTAALESGIDLNKLNDYLEKRNILGFINGIREAGFRADSIISSMLQFSRKSEITKKEHNLGDILDKSLELANKDYDLKKQYDFRDIEIIKDYDSGLKAVFCIETELEQVVLNLLRNAAQAIVKEKNERTPRITLRTMKEGTFARIEIEDNGKGMPEHIRKRIFDPFFTTKPMGQGTGLGLSVSYMIITNNHQGSMEVESKKDSGTRFIIRIPIEAL